MQALRATGPSSSFSLIDGQGLRQPALGELHYSLLLVPDGAGERQCTLVNGASGPQVPKVYSTTDSIEPHLMSTFV